MNELYHYGVKGMKWGVRRYHNKDGSLTPAGKKLYYNDDGSPTSAGLSAINRHKINIRDQREMQKKLHDSKNKKENEFTNRQYLLTSEKATKGEEYIKQLKKKYLRDMLPRLLKILKEVQTLRVKHQKVLLYEIKKEIV